MQPSYDTPTVPDGGGGGTNNKRRRDASEQQSRKRARTDLPVCALPPFLAPPAPLVVPMGYWTLPRPRGVTTREAILRELEPAAAAVVRELDRARASTMPERDPAAIAELARTGELCVADEKAPLVFPGDAPLLDALYRRWRVDLEERSGIYEIRDNHACWEEMTKTGGASLVTLDARRHTYGCRECGRTHRCLALRSLCPVRLADSVATPSPVCLISGRAVEDMTGEESGSSVPGDYEQELSARYARPLERSYLSSVVSLRTAHSLSATASFLGGDDRLRRNARRRADNTYELHGYGVASIRYAAKRQRQERRVHSADGTDVAADDILGSAVFYDSGGEAEEEEDSDAVDWPAGEANDEAAARLLLSKEQRAAMKKRTKEGAAAAAAEEEETARESTWTNDGYHHVAHSAAFDGDGGGDDGDGPLFVGRETGGVFSVSQIARTRLPHDGGRRWRLNVLDRFYLCEEVLGKAGVLLERWQTACHFATTTTTTPPPTTMATTASSGERDMDTDEEETAAAATGVYGGDDVWPTSKPRQRRCDQFVARIVAAARACLPAMSLDYSANDTLAVRTAKTTIRRALHVAGRVARLLEPHLATCPPVTSSGNTGEQQRAPSLETLVPRLARAIVQGLLARSLRVRSGLAWCDDDVLQALVEEREGRRQENAQRAAAVGTVRKSQKRPVKRRAIRKHTNNSAARTSQRDAVVRNRRREAKQVDILVGWMRQTLDTLAPSAAWLNAYVFDMESAESDERDTRLEGGLVLPLEGIRANGRS